MPIFTVVLQLSRTEREVLTRLAVAAERQAGAEERQAVAFEALIAKLNEDPPPATELVEFTIGPVREQP